MVLNVSYILSLSGRDDQEAACDEEQTKKHNRKFD